MKKTVNKESSNSTYMFISAIFGVFAAVLILSYSVYAWFTLSTQVVANGLNLSATAPHNILISLTGEEGTWSEKITITTPDILDVYGYDTSKDMLVIPASTYAGYNDTFFQTNKSLTNGQAMPNTMFDVGTALHVYKNRYEGHYIDVPLYFKTEGGTDTTLYLEINNLGSGSKITPLGGDLEIYRTARVAFLTPDGENNSVGGTAPLVFASADRSPIGGVITSSAVPGGAPVAPAFLTFDADGLSDSAIVNLSGADIENGLITPHVSQILVRIWIEGQDTYSTIAASGQSFNIDLKFSLREPTI